MLQALSIRDVVLIDRLDLDFQPGLNALTGETGAGKSILLDALGLALGQRADGALVRAGAAQAVASAAFALDIDHPARLLVREQGLDDGDVVVLRRVLGADGRGRAFVNDQPVNVGLLRRIGDTLVEIQGQGEDRGLLDAATHRAALDAYGQLAKPAAKTQAAFAAWRKAEDEATQAARDAEQDRAALADLRHAAAELQSLNARPGEEADLAETRTRLMNREKLVEALNAALAELTGGRAVDAAIGAAAHYLSRIADKAGGRLEPALAALDRAGSEIADALAGLQALGAELDGDPSRVEQAEERLFALRAAARKHRVSADELASLAASLAERLAAAEDREGGIGRLAEAAAASQKAFIEAAGALSRARQNAATRLDSAIAAELPPLKLDKAGFKTRIEALPEVGWTAAGLDKIWFEVTTNPGAAPGPLARIASGGERARFMLALKVVLSRTGTASTLVFDEVDSGVGGAVAAAVGERLGRLGIERQILVVTHSPQVAARADHHFRVVKAARGGETVARVETLDADARREEIARMLSGATITDAARAAAASLIAGSAA